MAQQYWLDENTFQFWMPATSLDVVKAKTRSGEETVRKIRGIASTSSRDLQGEIVEQNGIDTAYFQKYGYFNYDHKDGAENKVGEPTSCKLTKNGLYVEGILYQGKKVADHVWEHMQSLVKTPGSKRKMGFSIQGKVKRRQGNVIKECWIQDIAITPCPVNTTTFAEISKSLSEQQWDLKKEKEDDESEKALSVGAGHPTVPESLNREKIEDRTSKSLNFDECVAYTITHTGMSPEAATSVTRAIFNAFGVD
jgi:hypothetical protein